MKMRFAVLSFLAFPMVSSAYTGAWWMKGDGIVVTCEAGHESFPHLGPISIQGRTVTVEKNGEVLQWTTRTSQNSNSKVWDNKQISFYVSLQPSSWGGYHNGTLVFEGATPEYIPLFCYPQ